MSRASEILSKLESGKTTEGDHGTSHDAFEQEFVDALKQDWTNVKIEKDGSGSVKTGNFLAKWKVSSNDPAIWIEFTGIKSVKCSASNGKGLAAALEKLDAAISQFQNEAGI